MAFVVLDRLINLYDGYVQRFRIGRQEVVLAQIDGERYIFENRCPHKGLPLHQATIKGDVLRCPHHGLEINLHSGCSLNSNGQPNCLQNLKLFEASYDEDKIGVEL